MALIQLINETKLKSLKFGNDRPGGGSSTEPFIKSNIPQANPGGAPIPLATATSILAKLPGITDPGIGLATQASLTDTVRLNKFFATSQGLAFIAKQNILSKIAVRTEASQGLNEFTYLSTSTVAQAGINVFGGHLNKQGTNPFSGFGDSYTPDRYIDVIKGKITATTNQAFLQTFNPPTQTVTVLGLQPVGTSTGFGGLMGIGTALGTITSTSVTGLVGNLPTLQNFDRLIQLYADTIIQGNPGGILQKYSGGPGSTAGIGNTLIRFATSNTGVPLRTNDTPTIGVQNSTAQRYAVASSTDVQDEFNRVSSTPNFLGTIKVIDFRKALRDSKTNPTITDEMMAAAKAPAYQLKDGRVNIEGRVNLNNPAAPGRQLNSYVAGTGVNSFDVINAFPLYRSEVIPAEYRPKLNDLVKFRIAAIDNDNPKFNTYMHFRAFLGNITDNYNAEWESVQYMGRGDKLFSYKGFGRTLSLSWTVAAQSKKELIPMYKKLNYLASNLAPDYNIQGYMRGPLVYLTVGGYLYEVPGFITGLTYELGDDVPWEVGITDQYKDDQQGQTSDSSVKELPHVIKVTNFGFTPIHRFIPSKQTNVYGGLDVPDLGISGATTGSFQFGGGETNVGSVTKFGTSRFISLAAGGSSKDNNYDS